MVVDECWGVSIEAYIRVYDCLFEYIIIFLQVSEWRKNNLFHFEYYNTLKFGTICPNLSYNEKVGASLQYHRSIH